MKYFLLAAACSVFFSNLISGQNIEQHDNLEANDIVWTKGSFQGVKSIYDLNHQEIKTLNDSLNNTLQPKLLQYLDSTKTPKFQLPVSNTVNAGDNDFYTITAYYDHDSLYPYQVLDYACGDLSYDLEDGYNHSGTDFLNWPFPWRKMYTDEVQVIAAAEGILYYKQDGYFDQNCELNNEPWNGCAVLHPDGSASWYIHLKKNSLTDKFVGQEIDAGEYLGVVGSSGSSLAPHLHFEVFDPSGNYIDPFEGDCNPTITKSWWVDQLSYKEKGIVKLSTNSKIPVLDNCPQAEITYESNLFVPQDTVFLLIYFKNISENDQLELFLRKPDNTVYTSWIWNSPWQFYAASWLYFYVILDNDEFGQWRFEVVYDEKTYSHNFLYKETESIPEKESDLFWIYPNPTSENIFISTNVRINEIRLLDFYGVELIKNSNQIFPNSKTQISTAQLNNGAYFICIDTEFGSFTRKVIITDGSR